MKCLDIQLIVKSYLDRLGKNVSNVNKFKNNLLRKNWVKLFLEINNALYDILKYTPPPKQYF